MIPAVLCFVFSGLDGASASLEPAPNDRIEVTEDEAHGCHAQVVAVRAFEKIKREHPKTDVPLEVNRARLRACLVEYRSKPHPEVDRQKADEGRAADLKARRLIFSARICLGENTRDYALSKIAEEKKYSKVAGSVNLSRLEDLKNDLMDADKDIADFKALVRQMKTRPLGCKEPTLTAVIECSPTRLIPLGEHSEDGNACDADEMQGMLRLLGGSDSFRPGD